ncbi:hypothetical protein [Ectobacillus polymachus]|uniref:hypothetical protein n=1 Tax=Ectobacillus polymachus TaxID=1508806 RepID=UPI003A869719
MIQAINRENKAEVISFFKEHWGSSEMIISIGVYKCDELDGFVFMNDKNEIIRLVTYEIREDECVCVLLYF